MLSKMTFVNGYDIKGVFRRLLHSYYRYKTDSAKTTFVLVNQFCPVLSSTSLCFNKMELQEIQFDTSAEYAPVYDDEEISTENEVTIQNEKKQSTTSSLKAEPVHNANASSDGSVTSVATQVPRPTKKLAVELFDENMYSLPENALPESEPSSPVSFTSSVQKKPTPAAGWVCSTWNLMAVVFCTMLLTGGIFLVVYLPLTLEETNGQFGTYMITISI